MPRLLIRCPVTDIAVPTGLDVSDIRGFRRSLPASATIAVCEACRRAHTWWRSEAFLEDSGSDRHWRP